MPVQTQSLAMSVNNAATFQAIQEVSPFSEADGYGVARVQVTGAFTGTAIFEETLDGLNWFASPFAFADLAPTSGVPTVGPAGGTFTIKMPGTAAVRLRCITSGMGLAIVVCNIVDGSNIGLNPFNGGGSGGSGSLPTSTVVNQTSVMAALVNTFLLGANSARKAFSIYNESPTANLRISLNEAAASLTNFAYIVTPGGLVTPDINFIGDVFGIWDVADTPTGAARITEFT